MLIDWFTVGAQALNFLVLVWLLRRFLFGPISRAMEERQRGIDAQLEEAARTQAAAADSASRLREETARFDDQRESLIRGMREDIDDTRRAELAAARQEVEELRARWRTAVDRERDGFLLELRHRIGTEVVEVTRRVLADLADGDLEAQVIGRFLARIDALDDDQRSTLRSAAHLDGDRLHLRTGFAVAPELRTRVVAAVERSVGPGYELHLEVIPALVCGVELRAGGYAVGWSVDEHLDALELAISAAIGEGAEVREDA